MILKKKLIKNKKKRKPTAKFTFIILKTYIFR